MRWTQVQDELARLAETQLFFIGGAPRSGTTWLQQLLDCHPDISCRGEGLFGKLLAEPLDAVMARRRQGIEAKNALFGHTGGYPEPMPEDAEILLGTAILLALRRQTAGRPCLAVGEKTPENVFLFSRLKQLFPSARFIGIARDPRDVLASAWHFFHRAAAGEDENAAKIAFIRMALPSLGEGARAMIALTARYPGDVEIVTYESLQETSEPAVARLFRFLGVTDQGAVVRDCLALTSFAALSGRPAGARQNGAFLRGGISGDWRSTFTPEMNMIILRELGWMFPRFGWQGRSGGAAP